MEETTCEDLPPGAHLVTPRRGYLHHGIYVGVHYAGLTGALRRGPVEEVTLASFARGQGFRVKPSLHARYDAGEVVRRALSRLGENQYHVLRNNCEHFCEWCFSGQSRSAQVDAWLPGPRSAVRALGIALMHVLVPRLATL
jgi:hypothetical protein